MLRPPIGMVKQAPEAPRFTPVTRSIAACVIFKTASQHAVVSLKTWDVTGRVLLGLEPNSGLLF
jgi:hypothetical protein